jgi:protein phosphatase
MRSDSGVKYSTCTLDDQGALIRQARQRDEEAVDLTVKLILGVSQMMAEEFEQQRLVFRMRFEDILFDQSLERYAIAADLKRWDLGATLPSLTLLDNGIYPPELTGQMNRPLSPRSSVYCGAALIYHAVTGLEPVAGFSLISDKLPPVRIFEPRLPLGLDPILRRALARNPDQRYSDPVAFYQALKQAIEFDGLRRVAEVDAPLAITYAAATHPGINKSQKNPRNQDQFFDAWDPASALGVFLVADGVSTCRWGTGDRAALQVIHAARQLWEELQSTALRETAPSLREEKQWIAALSQLFAQANEAIIEEVKKQFSDKVMEEAAIMSSTAVATLLNGRQIIIGNVGDSRIYLVREGLIEQITVDLDRRTLLLRQGQGLDVLMNTSGLGRLTGRLGTCRLQKEKGGIEAAPSHAEFSVHTLLAGDRLLICSDGVPDCIGLKAEEKIQDIILASTKPAQAAWDLIVAANDNGGDDNITAIVLSCSGKEETLWPTR